MTNEYAAALEAHNVAFRAYDKVRIAYHALEIGDAEFIAAANAYKAATAKFDEAFAKEQAR